MRKLISIWLLKITINTHPSHSHFQIRWYLSYKWDWLLSRKLKFRKNWILSNYRQLKLKTQYLKENSILLLYAWFLHWKAWKKRILKYIYTKKILFSSILYGLVLQIKYEIIMHWFWHVFRSSFSLSTRSQSH